MVGTAPRALVLGTIPSAISDLRRQYYANPTNCFWRIVYAVWGREPDIDYAHRLRFLEENRLALWDVIRECDVRRSDDRSVKNVVINDVHGLLLEHPTIDRLFFNGRKAFELYGMKVNKVLEPEMRRPVVCLPSTSSANAIGEGRKKEAWAVLRAHVESERISTDGPGESHGALAR